MVWVRGGSGVSGLASGGPGWFASPTLTPRYPPCLCLSCRIFLRILMMKGDNSSHRHLYIISQGWCHRRQTQVCKTLMSFFTIHHLDILLFQSRFFSSLQEFFLIQSSSESRFDPLNSFQCQSPYAFAGITANCPTPPKWPNRILCWLVLEGVFQEGGGGRGVVSQPKFPSRGQSQLRDLVAH